MTWACKRVGHKGADLIAPGNTPESFDAALLAGVDMIEFDVLPRDPYGDRATEPLLLAHDYAHDLAHAPTLKEGLAHLASDPFAQLELDVDLKLPGYEDRVVALLREHDLVGRAIVSTQFVESLDRLRALEPALRLGWSIPKAQKDYLASRMYVLPALAALQIFKRRAPGMAAAALRSGRCDAIMALWRIVTPALVAAVADAGGELYAWTVDDGPQLRALEALGVSGLITNDPRLFATA